MSPVRRLLVAAALVAAPLATLAQAWPDKPIKLVVPYPAGGGVDFVGRTISQRLSEVLKQPVVVENRSGASGAVGAALVASSAPDGYTLLLASPAETVVGPVAGQKVPYDTQKDLAPIALVGETPLVIFAHPSVPATDLQSFVALARREPGKYSYATPGSGSSMHFAGESLNALAKIDVLHIPYKGAAPAVTDVLGGQVPIGIVGMPPTVNHAKNGKLRILAVTSDKRSAAMPDVPAANEMPGLEGYRFTNWMGLFAPAGTPAPVIERLAQEVVRITREPAVREKLLSQGVDPAGLDPAEFTAFMRGETERYGRIAKERKIRAE